MQTEYEATFSDIDKDEMRTRLKEAGATLVRPEYQQRRYVFRLPAEKDARHVWARVRDEGDKVTMSLKSLTGSNIEDQKEICITVSSFDDTVEFLKGLGCTPQSYQETLRELWTLGETEITIDTWPFLEPIVEIEGVSEDAVKDAALALGFDWEKALFCTVSKIYRAKYGGALSVSEIPHLTFEMQNPFTA